jgi:hypothetical protein
LRVSSELRWGCERSGEVGRFLDQGFKARTKKTAKA